MTGITRRFGSTIALGGVDFEVAAGEVHALLGENGAGKTTLMRVLAGLDRPDCGAVAVGGTPVTRFEPRALRALGVAMVQQHFTLVPTLTAGDNLALARPEGRIRPGARAAAERVERLADRYGLAVRTDVPAGRLSVGERQRLEILRALDADARLLVLDEPTAVLSDAESERLVAVCRRLAGEGRAVIVITHRLGEVFAGCDRVTVLRRGAVALAGEPVGDHDRAGLAALMVGPNATTPTKRPTEGGSARSAGGFAEAGTERSAEGHIGRPAKSPVEGGSGRSAGGFAEAGTGRSAEGHSGRSAEVGTERSAEGHIGRPAKSPVEEGSGRSAGGFAEAGTGRSAEGHIEGPVKLPVERRTMTSAERSVEAGTDRPAEGHTGRPAELPVEGGIATPAEAGTGRPAEGYTGRSVEVGAERSAEERNATLAEEPAEGRSRPRAYGPPRLRATGVALGRLTGADLEVRAGEIVGVAGVDGNGQAELEALLAGLEAPEAGQVTVDGRPMPVGDPHARVAARIAYIPSDRYQRGLARTLTLADNLELGRGPRRRPARRRRARAAGPILDDWDVRTAGPEATAASLSGGNAQKLVLARELGARPHVVIAAYPTRGLDPGAARTIAGRVVEAAVQGAAVVWFGAELDELFAVADRVVVLAGGRTTEYFEPPYDRVAIGLAMAGAATGTPTAAVAATETATGVVTGAATAAVTGAGTEAAPEMGTQPGTETGTRPEAQDGAETGSMVRSDRS